jgi:TonB-linked SusC/RagA family outer membrane protein
MKNFCIKSLSPLLKEHHKILLIMRLSLIFTFFTILQTTAAVFSQNVSIDVKDQSMREVLKKIETQSNYRFFYNDQLSGLNNLVTLRADNKSVKEVLDELLASQQLSYRLLENNMIVIAPNEIAQQLKVTGIVTDATTGEPLAGVSVAVEGSTVGTITDAKGKYTLDLPNSNSVLIFSYVSYLTERVPANGQSVIDVKLAVDMKKLEEVVVIGYGTVKRSDLTGAVSTVKGSDLKQLASSDVNQNLQGKVAGVQVIQNSGNPAGGTTVRIRGIGTINNSNPLYVVDGIPESSIDYLAPSDVENMEVLKDASASAIYGNRGANGVILITTKKGTTGAAKFSFDMYTGIQAPWRTLSLTNAQQYATLYKEAITNNNQPMPEPEGSMLDLVAQQKSAGTDWQKEIMNFSAPVQNYSLTVSGGTDKYKYNISGTLFSQDGTIRNGNLRKFFVRAANDWNLSKFLKGGFDVSFVNAVFNNYNVNQYFGALPVAISIDPITSAWDNSTNNYGNPVYFSQVSDNPAHIINDLANAKTDQNRLHFTVYGDAKIWKGLSFKSNFGIYLNNDHLKNYLATFHINPNLLRNEAELDENRETDYGYTWSNYFNYTQSFGGHNLNLMAGMESALDHQNGMQSKAYGVPSDPSLQYLAAAQSTTPPYLTSVQGEATMISYYGRLNYSFKDKYLLTATIRRDGTSRFASGQQWGSFPSFSLGWNIKKESFLSNVAWLDALKINGGYGEVGNQASAGYYDYVTTVNNNLRYVLGPGPNQNWVNGQIPERLSNNQLHWEIAKESNIGVHATLMRNFDIEGNYFVKKTSDMIIPVPIPEYVGATSPSVNAGSMSNKGFEASATYRGKISDFNFEIGINSSWIKNTVTSLGGSTTPFDGGSINKVGNVTRTAVGNEMSSFYGLRTAGIFHSDAEAQAYTKDGVMIQPNAKAGDLKFVDRNGDGKIDGNDNTFLGSYFPKAQGGINLSLEYKGIDLKAFGQFVWGNKICDALYLWDQSVVGAMNSLTSRMDRYDPNDNPNGTGVRMIAGDPNNNMRFSDRYIEDGSYFRLKNLQLGYSLPASLISKVGIKSLRIYVAADNLFTITKYKGYEPDLGELQQANSGTVTGNTAGFTYFGVDQATWPQSRIFRVGLNLNF